MRTILVERALPKMLAVKTLRRVWPDVCWSPLSPARVIDLPEPALPGPRWVKVKNRQCGICATDLSLLYVKVDPSVGPAALPGNSRFYLGHEVVSTVTEVGSAVTRFKAGDRVIMDTRFHGANCLSQEIDPPCEFCARDERNLCINVSANAGPRGAGGGWGDGYTAHESEVYPLPNDLDDDCGTLIEPMAVAVHAVLRQPPRSGDRVLIAGAGIIGLLTLQTACAVCPDCHITVLARHPYQAEAARRFGAREVVTGSAGYPAMARITGAKFYTAPLNKGMLLGGFDVIYDCVGSGKTIENNLRWARAGGTVVLVGIDLTPAKVDLNPIWYQEVDLIGSKGHGADTWRGERRHTYAWVIQLLKEGRLQGDGLITHRFRFEDYRQAVAASVNKAHTRSIKVVFDYN
ncbi:MAG TPA: zinc-binding dehydrogenase [Anaerolineae bacterium]|nr:zinc-binding dehydrogenase [Anaerolineae bacterium]